MEIVDILSKMSNSPMNRNTVEFFSLTFDYNIY